MFYIKDLQISNFFNTLYCIYGDFVVRFKFIKMAIPFSLPSDDTTLEQYRSIHRLLLDLTAILRTLLARNPEWIRSEAAQSKYIFSLLVAMENMFIHVIQFV